MAWKGRGKRLITNHSTRKPARLAPVNSGVEAVEKPQIPYFIENREIYHIDY